MIWCLSLLIELVMYIAKTKENTTSYRGRAVVNELKGSEEPRIYDFESNKMN